MRENEAARPCWLECGRAGIPARADLHRRARPRSSYTGCTGLSLGQVPAHGVMPASVLPLPSFFLGTNVPQNVCY
jgi:hypothetical protein